MMGSLRVNGFFRVLVWLFMLLALAGCNDRSGGAMPSVYLLSHQAWIPMLVINFPQEVAPLDAVGKPPEVSPILDIPDSGIWLWADASRLEFAPTRQPIRPDTTLSIDLKGLKLRPGASLIKQKLHYKTPSLKILRHECHWRDRSSVPLQRVAVMELDFNYPASLMGPDTLQARIESGSPLRMEENYSSKLRLGSAPLPRPEKDSILSIVLPSGDLRLHDIDGPTTHIYFSAGVTCQLPVKRTDWGPEEAPVVKAPEPIPVKPPEPTPAKPPEPQVTGIHARHEGGKIHLTLQGDNLTEPVRRLRMGEPAGKGIETDPPLAGSWRYGSSAYEGDLIFSPAEGRGLPPGIWIKVTLSADAFPGLITSKLNPYVRFRTPEMSSSITDVSLYTDPEHPTVKRITATLSFSHPPQRDSLSANISVRLDQESGSAFSSYSAQEIPFELVYDEKKPLLVYLKSVPIPIPQKPSYGKVYLGKVQSAWGGEPTRTKSSEPVDIPEAASYFQVTGAETQSAIKPNGDLERVLILRTSLAVKDPQKIPQAVEAYVLPDCGVQGPQRPAFCEEKGVNYWTDTEQVDANVLKASNPVSLSLRESNEADKIVQYLTFSAPEKRQVLIKIAKGLEAAEGFTLAEDSRFLIELGENQREIKILHDGALLSLSGTKKLGLAVRGVDRVRLTLQRVLPHNMHHLIQLSEGRFQQPTFNVPIEHFTERFEYDEVLPPAKEMSRQYLAVDFARFAPKGGEPPRGLFMLSAAKGELPPCPPPDTAAGSKVVPVKEGIAKNPAECKPAAAVIQAANTEGSGEGEGEGSEEGGETTATSGNDAKLADNRLILLTDMGLLAKRAPDGTQQLFVISFHSGKPVEGAKVSLLGMNGVALASGKTDAQGRVSLPSVEGLAAEKTPTVYLAEKNGDLSFLPYSRNDRLMNLSRFEIGGLNDRDDSLHAYLFNDRGIYRPGDTAHIGLILRKRDWSALPAGLPLKAVITDPQEQEVWSQTLAFGAEGFEEIAWTTPEQGKTGTYRVELFVADKQGQSLGSTTLRVEEFQPDRLQVKTEIPGARARGWRSPEGMKAQVSVRNLFGTPAAGNSAQLEMTLRPWLGEVPGFPDYRFRGTLAAKIPAAPQTLSQKTTDEAGMAEFDLPLESIAEPVYQVTLAGEGFEKGSGRSVVAVTSALVSRQPFLLGHLPDGSLDYIAQKSVRKLTLVALGPDFQPLAAEGITVERYETRYVSTLVKRPDGLYSYQSVARDEPRGKEPLTLTDGKADLALITEEPGSYYLIFKDAQGAELNRVSFTVAGEGNVTRNIERNADLDLRLNKKEYLPGEKIELQIVAPYKGAGLITIEQDQVLTSQWFRTDTTSSTHSITLPKDLKGNAYLSVAFVRSMESPEIYMSPLSYGVVPFTISRQPFTGKIALTVPPKVKPGGNLEVRYKVEEPTRLVLYAVDEGILQFAHYRNPAPLDYFFRKRALQVDTRQILDLILPDHALVQRLSAPGGDEDAELFGKYKNPFARRNKPPMAFWSGIIDAKPGEHQLSVPVPDYFNGSIRVLAMAVTPGRVAVPVSQTAAANPYVIQPQQPLAVAPGDEFEVGVLVANATGEPGEQALTVALDAPEALEVLTESRQPLTLGPGKEGTVRFRVKARDELGPVEIDYRVAGKGQEASYSEELSIRPSQPLATTLTTGILRIDDQLAGKRIKLSPTRDMYGYQRFAEVGVSKTPAIYLRGVLEYLKHYPYGCVEQLTSKAFPAVVLGANPDLGLSPQDVKRYFAETLGMLQARQMSDGSFGYWSQDRVLPFYSIYATHMLIEARARGFRVPDSMFDRAIQSIDQYTQVVGDSWDDWRNRAYGLYLLSRQGQNVAERLRDFEAKLEAQAWRDGWRNNWGYSNWIRFFLGASYKLHHLDADAERHLGGFLREWKKGGLSPSAYSEDLSIFSYLVNTHAPELLDPHDPQFGRYLLELSEYLTGWHINSFSGSMASLGLGSLLSRIPQANGEGFKVTVGDSSELLDLQGDRLPRAEVDPDAGPWILSGDGNWNLYYQLTERGYDRNAPTKEIVSGLSIHRSLLNEQGKEVKELGLQEKLHIRLSLHPDRDMENVAVVVLIPGGFEIDLDDSTGLGARQSLPVEGKSLWRPDHIDVQEDRVVFFGSLRQGATDHFEFRLKPLNVGTYAVPPLFAEAMYDTEIRFRGLGGTIRVKE